jgi:hypothetical protein
MGVTLKVWQKAGYDKNGDGFIDEEDLKQIFRQYLVECILRPYYWNRWQADRIHNQSIANLLVDWVWASGPNAIRTVQRMLNLTPDGVAGEKTLAAVNDYSDPKELFERIKAERIAYIYSICESRPANRRYKKGWLNRLNDIKFAFIALLCIVLAFFSACRSSTETTRVESERLLRSVKELEQRVNSRWNENAVTFHTLFPDMGNTDYPLCNPGGRVEHP